MIFSAEPTRHAGRCLAMACRAIVTTGLLTCAGGGAVRGDLCDGVSAATGNMLTTVRVASGLSRPTLAVAPPGDPSRLFIVEQDGRIRILRDGVLLPVPFLSIEGVVRSPADGAGNEEGLLGLAFHPGYAANGWFFVYHTNVGGDNVLARYTVSVGDPDLADVTSRETVITVAHPAQTNHNGGMIAFSPVDGQLYLGTGDGGGACDLPDNAQNGTSNLGKLLRLGVDTLPLTVPVDNPFAGVAGTNDEIWARGLRNPWRWSFDRQTGDLYIGDVGQGAWEEIDVQPASSGGGENYGWDLYEGNHCPPPGCLLFSACNSITPVSPVIEYAHGGPGGGCSVTGGYVYRGCRVPALRGTYFYADFCTEFVRTLQWENGQVIDTADRTVELAPLGATIDMITAFGEDGRGEIYILDRGGEVFKVVPALGTLEVSGVNSVPLVPTSTDWTWEDLQFSSSHPLTSYRVWRQDGAGSAPFDCVFETPVPTWIGGDPESPLLGDVFTYLVTAMNGVGEMTSAGTGSGGAPRLLSAAACPL